MLSLLKKLRNEERVGVACVDQLRLHFSLHNCTQSWVSKRERERERERESLTPSLL